MAIDNELSSLLTPKQRLQIEDLIAELTRAEADSNVPTPVADNVKVAERFVQSFSVDALAETFKGMSGGQKAATAFARDAIERVQLLIAELVPHRETVDRAALNAVVAKIAKQYDGDGFDDDAMPAIADLLGRAVAVKGASTSRGSGESRFGPLSFRVWSECTVAGCKDERHPERPFRQWTEKDNVNSIRHYDIKHLREAHGIELSAKYNGDAAAFAELTDAVEAIMHGGMTEVNTRYARNVKVPLGAPYPVAQAAA